MHVDVGPDPLRVQLRHDGLRPRDALLQQELVCRQPVAEGQVLEAPAAAARAPSLTSGVPGPLGWEMWTRCLWVPQAGTKRDLGQACPPKTVENGHGKHEMDMMARSGSGRGLTEPVWPGKVGPQSANSTHFLHI